MRKFVANRNLGEKYLYNEYEFLTNWPLFWYKNILFEDINYNTYETFLHNAVKN